MRTKRFRFTIEWIRTLVLGVGCLLIVSLIGFLAIGKWRNRLSLREIPKRLGVDIQQEANGVTYTQAHSGHTLFKIHASKVVQLKAGGKALLHDVQIELYGDDGSRVDRISGNEFEYDQKEGKAVAGGPVEITLSRPSDALSLAGKAKAGTRAKGTVLSNAEQAAARGEIHVKTSGLTFDSKSGVASTQEKVDFSVQQGNGSSIGAMFDSGKGLLVLDHAVELNLRRDAETITLLAHHAEFERGDQLCRMRDAEASFREGHATVGQAIVLFRSDGSASKLEASDGVTLKTANSATLTAPRGTLDFSEHNQPQRGRLEGGATLESHANENSMHASSPSADLAFNANGELKHAHLERGVAMQSTRKTIDERSGATVRATRDWHSPVADLDFRDAGRGRVELASVRGTGGVEVTGESQTGSAAPLPSRLVADEMTGILNAGQELTALKCVGHTRLEQVNSAGAKQTITGDQLDVAMASRAASLVKAQGKKEASVAAGGQQIESAVVQGNVALDQQPAARPGAATVLHATAGKALYEGAAGLIHLSSDPRVEDGQLQLSANLIDISRESGDAVARGNVKATWLAGPGNPGRAKQASEPQTVGLGGQGPAHVISDEAQLRQSSGEATFRGNVRMWQQANSILAPTIVLDRQKQTLVAHGNGQANPVRMVLLSAGNSQGQKDVSGGRKREPSMIRVRGGDLKYSEAERKVVMRGGTAGNVEAQTGGATSESANVELLLLPPHNHAGEDGSAAQVDKLVAAGDVVVSSMGRRGTGDKLVYASETGNYVLTGTAANPPRMDDPSRGTVSGDSLIFNSRDGSVSIEGDGTKTSTQTSIPK